MVRPPASIQRAVGCGSDRKRSYADSAATPTAYRREVERLIGWAVLQLGKPLSLDLLA
ncbi:hypothetical protein Tamer19_58170 [Cupriavidus sp. TA19]|nr:hypothetical protein Tamer19_58170 [Cupriavidus sp. TA19]